jgi:mono/diheme cytochrome c family protein
MLTRILGTKTTTRRLLAGAAAAAAAIALLPAAAHAQDGPTSVWDGAYTEAQATRGEGAYERECATCHLADLLGDGIAPALVGAAFDFRWRDLSVGDIFVAIRATMPQGAPASLSPQAYADIVSYLLKRNDFPAGDSELPTAEAALNAVIIHGEPPAPSAEAADPTVWDGVFTAEQATRGEGAYERECATCHLADLLGDGIAPALVGAAFDFRWHRRRLRLPLERPVRRRHLRRHPGHHAPGRAGQPQPAGLRRHRELSAEAKRLPGGRQRTADRRGRAQRGHHPRRAAGAQRGGRGPHRLGRRVHGRAGHAG